VIPAQIGHCAEALVCPLVELGPDTKSIFSIQEATVQLSERKLKYEAIEAYRKRPLIVYATSTRPNIQAQMAGDAVREFVDQIDAIEGESQIDVLVHSTGGDPLTAWKLMSILRERFDRVDVLVPYMAFSAATLFALGANEIVMHPHASLGPIDPQIMMVQPDGSVRRFAYEDVGAFLRFIASEVKITEQVHLSAVIEKLFSVVDPVNVGAAKRASELSSTIGERLLLLHMTASEEKARARQIAENLNKSFFAHGDAVSRTRAKELQLKIAKEDRDLEKLIWEAYRGIESYMDLRSPFIPIQHYLSDAAGAAALRPAAPVAVPPNAPPPVLQQIWQAALNQALQGLANAAIEVPYSIVNALIESPRVASEFRTEGAFSASRGPNGDIQLAGTDSSSRWRPVQLPVATAAGDGAVPSAAEAAEAAAAGSAVAGGDGAVTQ
jgi:hypothetical protein